MSLSHPGLHKQDSVMSVLAVCQRQLESELLLVKKEMHLRTEDRGKAPGRMKVLGHMAVLLRGRDVTDIFAEVTCTLRKTADRSRSYSRLFRSVLKFLHIVFRCSLDMHISHGLFSL